MKQTRSILFFFCHLVVIPSFSQTKEQQLFVENICNNVKQVIGDEWFISQTNEGFDVYYCRTCNENYQKWLNEKNRFWKEHYDTPISQSKRYEFFSPELADSVSYYATVSRPSRAFDDTLNSEFDRDWYKKNGILKIQVRFEKKWTDEAYCEVEQKNELLKTEMLKEPLYKASMDMFSDCRFWLPELYWKQRTASCDFFFQRLPYKSCFYDYSIFIVPDKPYFFTDVLYVDSADEFYYKNKNNFIEDERCKILKIIAVSLGITDFKLVN